MSTGALSISELASRTGVPQATLRTWEARHGVPCPRRLPGGHRRYDENDVELVQQILRGRAAGLTMRTAAAQAGSDQEHGDVSVFAGLRRRHPELQTSTIRKTTLLALTRAVEDECCARAERPMLFASFQQRRFYQQSEPRWRELSRTARAVVVFADFPRRPPGPAWPLKVPVPADEQLQREWMLVCDSSDYPAMIAGWEHPGQSVDHDRNRRFEVIWTVDPVAVRDAALICLDLASRFAPGAATRLADLLPDAPAPASPDLARASGVLNRMLAYLESAY